jgi:hypothetical protein
MTSDGSPARSQNRRKLTGQEPPVVRGLTFIDHLWEVIVQAPRQVSSRVSLASSTPTPRTPPSNRNRDEFLNHPRGHRPVLGGARTTDCERRHGEHEQRHTKPPDLPRQMYRDRLTPNHPA